MASRRRELDDGRLDTQWREELASAGEGQFFTFQPRVANARAQQLRIVPAARTFNRPRALVVVGAQGAIRVELPDGVGDPAGSAYVADLPQPIAGCTTVILESAHGRANGQTAIAELEVFAEGERTGGGEALLARVVAEGKGDTTGAATALAKRGAAAAAAIDVEIGRTRDAGARRRLIGALVRIKDPAAVASLVRAASDGWVRGQDLLDVIAALASNGQIEALRDLAGKSALAVEVRIAAASQLAPNAIGLPALIELAGAGPRELRHAVIERLALAPAANLAVAAKAAPTAARAGDLWRAATRHARHATAERGELVDAMRAALVEVADYERRYRLVDGIAAYGDAVALAALDGFLRGLPRGADSSALRQVAIGSLAASPRPDATRIALGFARDYDPGVRLAAISALASAETDASDTAAIDRLLSNRLAKDHWPEIRRRAASALGGRCQRALPARALIDAVAADHNLDVRGDSLTALVQCNATGVRDLLVRTWSDPKAPPTIRGRAIDLVVALGDKPLAATLVALYARWRGESLASAEALELAQHAAAVLGLMNPPGAAAVLADALDDAAFPELVSSAALALGALGRACPASAKAKLAALARSEDRSAAVARRAAAQCGR
ncbi:MAG: HEAT repeat domain-containing protein [Kofleriaceae bacterium]